MTTSDPDPYKAAVDINDRLMKVMGILVVTGTVATGIFVSVRFGIGFLVGGVCSLLNYYWLKATLRKFFEKAVEGEPKGMMGARFILRYFLLAMVVVVVWLSGILPVVSVLFGLAGFALAVVIEGIVSIFRPVKV